MRGLDKQLMYGFFSFRIRPFTASLPSRALSLSLLRHGRQLKMTSKELDRMSKKCEKEEKAEREKIKKALSKDNQDGMQNIRLSQLSRAGIYIMHA